VEDRTRSYTSPFVGSEAGMITVPPYQSSGSSSTTGN
jgi:hypothetical protein